MGGGANEPSLIEAHENFLQFGASTRRRLAWVRAPSPKDHRDPDWRPLISTDVYQDATAHDATYPSDYTALYYWRPTYWLRQQTG